MDVKLKYWDMFQSKCKYVHLSEFTVHNMIYVSESVFQTKLTQTEKKMS